MFLLRVYHDVASTLKFERIMMLPFEPTLYFYNHMYIICLYFYTCTTYDHGLVKVEISYLLTYI